MSTSLENALLDVRKAYRLLADYQARLIDLLAIIQDELGAVNYYPCYRHTPPRSFDRLERCNDAGWRFLPMSDMSILWRRDAGQDDPIHYHKEGDLLIDVLVRSDTGNGQYKNELIKVEESSSELSIYFFLCVKPEEESHNWYHRVWNKTEYPELNKVVVCENNPGYLMYGESLKLANLTNELAIKETIEVLRKNVSTNLGYKIWD
ncbi:MAG: hypothetical protein ACXWE9_09910 [Methylobacter sp.]